MATNRTKIDWSYNQAKKLLTDGVFHTPQDQIRAVATAMRRAYRKGRADYQNGSYKKGF
jgi:hypothetical protein